MEMKYLREQDTGKRYLPVVHINGIVGLDTDEVSSPNIQYYSLNDDEKGVYGSVIIREYNKIVTVSLDLSIEPDTDGTSAFKDLKLGSDVILSLNTALNTEKHKYTSIVFDCLAYDENGVSSNILANAYMVQISETEASIIISTSTSDDIPYTAGDICSIVGSAVGLIIGRY